MVEAVADSIAVDSPAVVVGNTAADIAVGAPRIGASSTCSGSNRSHNIAQTWLEDIR